MNSNFTIIAITVREGYEPLISFSNPQVKVYQVPNQPNTVRVWFSESDLKTYLAEYNIDPEDIKSAKPKDDSDGEMG